MAFDFPKLLKRTLMTNPFNNLTPMPNSRILHRFRAAARKEVKPVDGTLKKGRERSEAAIKGDNIYADNKYKN